MYRAPIWRCCIYSSFPSPRPHLVCAAAHHHFVKGAREGNNRLAHLLHEIEVRLRLPPSPRSHLGNTRSGGHHGERGLRLETATLGELPWQTTERSRRHSNSLKSYERAKRVAKIGPLFGSCSSQSTKRHRSNPDVFLYQLRVSVGSFALCHS